MIKAITFQLKRLSIRAKLRHATSVIDECNEAIAHHNAQIDAAWRARADLQAELFWLEKNNLPAAQKRMAA